TAVGGLAMGAIPISTAIVILCTRAQPPRRIRAFWVRREEKTHGLGGVVSGTLEPADRVVIVDDVTTTGKSVLQAIDAVLAKGVKVLKVVSVVDRLEGARETIEKRGIKFESLYTRDEVLGE
ncbi:MAG TPA: phosphoribosyltransferase family protein, partial [Thermoplasmata archaeon]|nr:phosphoribosyltransferase family protein [Thermoplasmata archaeon]